MGKIGGICIQIQACFSQCILLSIYLILGCLLSWEFTALSFTACVFIACILYRLTPSTTHTGKMQQQAHTHLMETLHNYLGGLKQVKTNGQETLLSQATQEAIQTNQDTLSHLQKIKSGTQLAYTTIGGIFIISMLYLGLSILHLPTGQCILLILLFLRFLPRTHALHQAIQQLLYLQPAFTRIESEIQDAQQASEEQASHSNLKFKKTITLESCEYHPILGAINLTIQRGKNIVITGKTGAGKSTLADILSGLHTPSKGKIFIDGELLTDTERKAWRALCSYLPQSPFMPNVSIRAYLLMGAKDKSEHAMWEILSHMQIHERIADLPLGLDTLMGDQGIQFSGGEQQRIALSAALLQEKPILILDEATSHLDKATEKNITDYLTDPRHNITLIMITHSMHSLANIDHKIIMNAGKILALK